MNAPPGRAEEAAPPALPPLTAREAELATALRGHVERLAGEIGERHLGKLWNLASATDLLAGQLESLGYAVNRRGYSVGEEVVQNLEVEIGGGKLGRQLVIVGAHYDTEVGTPGADDNASGVAAVLCLAEALRGATPDRTLRLVLFANEEAPHFGTAAMGSLVYAKDLAERGAEVFGMISVESIGYFSDAPASQKYPDELRGRYPDVGDFIALVSNETSAELLGRVAKSMQRVASIEILAAALPEATDGVGLSDHWAFWRLGYPALMLTDTAPFRNPNYHAPSDLPETLNYDRMARVVLGLEHAVRDLVTEKPSASTAP